MSGVERKLPSDREHLFQAVKEGRVKKSRIILEASEGLLDRARNEDGHTLLIAACYTKASARLHMVNMLLDRDPEVNRRDLKGQTALSCASELGHLDVIARLIQHRSVDPDAFDFKGNTPLMHAAINGQTEVIILLSQNFRRLGLKVDQMNDEGFTALLLAARHGHIESCKALVNHARASRGIKDKYNNLLPIEWLRKSGSCDISIEFLRPRERFFRIAKLATTLAKAKSFSDKGILSTSSGHHIVRAVSDKKMKQGLSKLQKQNSEEARTKRQALLSTDLTESKSCPHQNKLSCEKDRKRRNSKLLETKGKPRSRSRKKGVLSCQTSTGGSEHRKVSGEERHTITRSFKRKDVEQTDGGMRPCTMLKSLEASSTEHLVNKDQSKYDCADSVATSLEATSLEERVATKK